MCCTGNILLSGVMCSVTREAPCIVDDAVDVVTGEFKVLLSQRVSVGMTPSRGLGEIEDVLHNPSKTITVRGCYSSSWQILSEAAVRCR